MKTNEYNRAERVGDLSDIAEAANVRQAGETAETIGAAMAGHCDRVAIDIMRKAGVVCPVMGEVAP
jgi:hypothetical protein